MRPDLIADLFEKEESYWWPVSKREMVFSLLRDTGIKQDRGPVHFAVDIGCGPGFTAKLFEPNWRIVAVDVSMDALTSCQRRGLTRLSQVDVRGFSLPFRTGSFDLVLALDVIEHVEDDLRALSECRRILKDGGLLIVTVPAFMALWSPWDEALGHKRRYTAGSPKQPNKPPYRLSG
ncbi:MAG: class I SAM-dependent methyltransferase [Candidatus Binatia bacterium]